MAPTSQKVWPFRNELLSTKPGANQFDRWLCEYKEPYLGKKIVSQAHQNRQALRTLASQRPRRLGKGMKIRGFGRTLLNTKSVAIQRVTQGLRWHDQGRSLFGEMSQSLRRWLMSRFDRFALCVSE